MDIGPYTIVFEPGDTFKEQSSSWDGHEQPKEKSKDEVRQQAIADFRKAIQVSTRGQLHEMFSKALYPLVVQLRAAGGSDHELASQLREVADFLEDIG